LPYKCWDILVKRFGGFELKRMKEKDLYNRKFNVKFPEVR